MNHSNLLSNQLLTAEMNKCDQLGDWTPEWRSALLVRLFTADQLSVQDLLDTLADWDRNLPLRKHVDLLTARYSPSEVYGSWQTCSHWATTVQHRDLTDLIGNQTIWTPTLALEVSYWLQERATHTQASDLAAMLGHIEVPEATRLCGEIDPEAIAFALSDMVSPPQMREAWLRITAPHATTTPNKRSRRRRNLTRAHADALTSNWDEFARLPRAGRWHTQAGHHLIEQLRRYRAQGVAVADLAACLDLSPSVSINSPQSPGRAVRRRPEMAGSYRTNPNTGYTIGRYIRESRGRLSRSALSRKTGISAYRLRQYETDSRPVDPDSLWAIVQALDMHPAEAFRCARYPGAWQLPENLQEPPRLLLPPQRAQITTYLDIITGRDATDRHQPSERVT
jgi:transcriptional regulator with XRE-family HTH domain